MASIANIQHNNNDATADAQAAAAKYKNKVRELYNKHQCHPLKTFLLPWIQVPLFVSMSLALRKMAAWPIPFFDNASSPLVAVDGFETGGVFWFLDLTVADPTVLLPLAVGGLHLANVQLNMNAMENKQHHPTPFQRALKLVLQGLAVAMIPVATQVPAVLALYWTTSAAFSLVQNIVVRRLPSKVKINKN